jgi:CRISPR-associated endoribonuclease Cas6
LRVKITFQFPGKLMVPKHHYELLHGLIYASIRNEEYRDQLHNEGFKYEKRQFRNFCFSRLRGKLVSSGEKVVFDSPVSFIFSTCDERLMKELISTLFTKDHVMIGHQRVTVASVEQIEEQISDSMRIRMLTPVTMYSTFMHNERRKTYYYAPFEQEFNELIAANAYKKYEALFNKPPSDHSFTLTPLDKRQLTQVTYTFKKTVIKGWLGDFVLQGSPELLKLVYEVGLGAKSSNGAGLFEVIHHLTNEQTVNQPNI